MNKFEAALEILEIVASGKSVGNISPDQWMQKVMEYLQQIYQELSVIEDKSFMRQKSEDCSVSRKIYIKMLRIILPNEVFKIKNVSEQINEIMKYLAEIYNKAPISEIELFTFSQSTEMPDEPVISKNRWP